MEVTAVLFRNGAYLSFRRAKTGLKLDFTKLDLEEVLVSVATSGKPPCSNELMPSPHTLRLHELKEMNTSLYIQYELTTKRLKYFD